MKLFVALVLALFTQAAYADQNPAPASVGLWNYSVFTAGTGGFLMLPRNANRASLTIQNNGSVSVVIKPGSAPANATDGIVITAGSTFSPAPTWVDAIYGESASATAKVIMIEGVK
jgi:hypothetical protein